MAGAGGVPLPPELQQGIDELQEAIAGEKPREGGSKQLPRSINHKLPHFACIFARHTQHDKVLESP